MIPAEWHPHARCWIAWPHSEALWGIDLPYAQQAVAELCHAIATKDPDTGMLQGEAIHLLVDPSSSFAWEQELPITQIHPISFGDIWLRDTGPIFAIEKNQLHALCFSWTGWGGKYMLKHDNTVSQSITDRSEAIGHTVPFPLEGGSVDFDGEGTCLTTWKCLNNRSPQQTKQTFEEQFKRYFAVKKVLWLHHGLINDHTDGHVDTLARFVAPNVVLCMKPHSKQDPNYDTLTAVYNELSEMTDHTGKHLRIVTIPTPGSIFSSKQTLMPASYLNFYIGNRTVVIPSFDIPQDKIVIDVMKTLFPQRRIVAINARRLLIGGGAFHCITCHQPKLFSS